MLLVQLFQKKEKKKKKKKNDPYSGMGKITRVMPQMPHSLSFLLGKGENPYDSDPMKSYLKIAHNMYIFTWISCLSSKQKGTKFGTSIPDQDPSNKAHLEDKI